MLEFTPVHKDHNLRKRMHNGIDFDSIGYAFPALLCLRINIIRLNTLESTSRIY